MSGPRASVRVPRVPQIAANEEGMGLRAMPDE